MQGTGSLRLTVAGRTDAGVHATHQVCHVDVPDQTLGQCVGHMNLTPVQALQTRLSRMMPDDIAIHGISVAPAGFDARFSALERTYVYRIADARVPWDPRLKDFAWRTDRELDIAQMNAAAALTLGLHDFGSFAIANPGGTTIREVKTAYWQRVPTRPLLGPGMGERYHTPAVESGLLCFTIVADAFARNMVRSLVGACVQVGMGKRDVDRRQDACAVARGIHWADRAPGAHARTHRLSGRRRARRACGTNPCQAHALANAEAPTLNPNNRAGFARRCASRPYSSA